VVVVDFDLDQRCLCVADRIGQALLNTAVNRQIHSVTIARSKLFCAKAEQDLRTLPCTLAHKLIKNLLERHMAKGHWAEALEHSAVDRLEVLDRCNNLSGAFGHLLCGFFGELSGERGN
jgi:hypothetical protein